MIRSADLYRVKKINIQLSRHCPVKTIKSLLPKPLSGTCEKTAGSPAFKTITMMKSLHC
jgi:hypothetical protein